MRRWRLRLVVACLSVLLWSGCATRHQSFRVAPIGGFPYLLPPDYTDNNNDAAAGQRTTALSPAPR